MYKNKASKFSEVAVLRYKPKEDNAPKVVAKGRIVMIADQYDALRSERFYKPPLNHEEVCRIITEGDGKTMPVHFDSKVLDEFIGVASVFDDIIHAKVDGYLN